MIKRNILKRFPVALNSASIYELSTVLLAFSLTVFAGLATGIGGAIGVARRAPSNRFMASALGRCGVFAGIAVIAVIDRLVPEEINPHEPDTLYSDKLQQRRSKMMKVGVLTAIALAIHNFPEGFATFVAALEDPGVGNVVRPG